jgi:two-component system chemotaxis sensor kinase CheA
VVGEDDEVDADLVIASQGAELPEDAAAHTIWLRTEPEAKNKKDESIYRYDRAGLLMALKSAGGASGTEKPAVSAETKKVAGRGK